MHRYVPTSVSAVLGPGFQCGEPQMRPCILLLTMIAVAVADSSFSVASIHADCTMCHYPFQQEESRVRTLRSAIERLKEGGADTRDLERRLAAVTARLRSLKDERDAAQVRQAAGVDAELAGLERVLETGGAKGLAPLTVWGSLLAALLLRLLIRHYDRTDP